MKCKILLRKASAAFIFLLGLLAATEVSAREFAETGAADGSVAVSQADKNARKAARRTLRGYKAFVEAGYSAEIIHIGSNKWDKMEFSTSHGFQLNNYLFVGGGASVIYAPHNKEVAVPVFGNVRVNFMNKAVVPFFDAKVGGAFGAFDDLYYEFGIGVRVGLKNRHAVYGGMVVSYQGYTEETRTEHSYSSYTERFSELGFKIGFEF